MKKKILLVHQNLPSQFSNLIPFLKNHPNVELVGIKEKNESSPFSYHKVLRDMNIVEYTLANLDRSKENFLVSMLDNHVLRGQIVGRIADALKKQNFIPDVIIGHSGWGELLFLKDRFPKAHFVVLQEFFHGPQESDINFDPEFQIDDRIIDVSIMNRSIDLQACFDADVIMTPTQWQAEQIPSEFQRKIKVVHDGIRTDIFKPDETAEFKLRNGKILSKKDKVITYIARGLEPYRGFHSFVRALPEIQRQDPEVEIVIVGNDDIYYSPPLADSNITYRQYYFNQVKDKVDFSRIHIYANLPQELCKRLLQISTVHAYYTYPFFSSLSILEAMSTGCVVLGSKTGPVEEFITDGRTGYLFDFFNTKQFAKKAIEIINQHPDERYRVGMRARDFIKACLDWETKIQPFWERFLKIK